jgi:predicted Co/Zn/Cd cation transporter (cation efflux family)
MFYAVVVSIFCIFCFFMFFRQRRLNRSIKSELAGLDTQSRLM